MRLLSVQQCRLRVLCEWRCNQLSLYHAHSSLTHSLTQLQLLDLAWTRETSRGSHHSHSHCPRLTEQLKYCKAHQLIAKKLSEGCSAARYITHSLISCRWHFARSYLKHAHTHTHSHSRKHSYIHTLTHAQVVACRRVSAPVSSTMLDALVFPSLTLGF